jgi:hypothetical protein
MNKSSKRSQRKNKQNKKSQRGGAGAAAYSESVFGGPGQQTAVSQIDNTIKGNVEVAGVQHNSQLVPVQGGGALLPLSPGIYMAGGDGEMPSTPVVVTPAPVAPAPVETAPMTGGKMPLTTVAVPAVLLAANQLYSRRRIGTVASGKGRRMSRRMNRTSKASRRSK